MLGLDWRGHHVLEVKDEYLMDLKAERVDTAKIGPILLHLKDENVNRCYNFFDFIKTVAVKRKQFVLPNVKINQLSQIMHSIYFDDIFLEDILTIDVMTCFINIGKLLVSLKSQIIQQKLVLYRKVSCKGKLQKIANLYAKADQSVTMGEPIPNTD